MSYVASFPLDFSFFPPAEANGQGKRVTRVLNSLLSQPRARPRRFTLSAAESYRVSICIGKQGTALNSNNLCPRSLDFTRRIIERSGEKRENYKKKKETSLRVRVFESARARINRRRRDSRSPPIKISHDNGRCYCLVFFLPTHSSFPGRYRREDSPLFTAFLYSHRR